MKNLSNQSLDVNNKNQNLSYNTDILRSYLHEIGNIPMLSHDQEIEFGQKVQEMMKLLDAKEKLALQLKRQPTNQEWSKNINLSEELLIKKLKQGHQAKQKMIQSNLRLVVSVAKRYQKRNLDLLDLIQEGSLGLERAVEKFDPTRGYKFSTYAYWWIRQAITRAISEKGRTIRLPIHVIEKLNKIKKTQRELSQKLGRIPTAADIALAISLEPKQVRSYLLLARQTISLELRIGVEKETPLQDILEDDGISPEIYTEQKFLQQNIQNLLSKLTPQQREVLTLRFGLSGTNELSLEQIGQRIGVSRERVRQIEAQALTNLRRYKESLRSHLAS